MSTPPPHPSLADQIVVPAQPATKIRLSLLATALIDALGGPPEFHRRFTFPMVTEMQDNLNFNLGKGVWTDDTSMALCLAKSIVTYPNQDGFNEGDQLDAYTRWWQNGELSAVDECFDIGNTIARALHIWANFTAPNASRSETSSTSQPAIVEDAKVEKRRQAGLKDIAKTLDKPAFSGNGSLMRVLPIGLAYYSLPDDAIAEYARRSSLTTHPNKLCQEACAVWTGAVVRVIRAAAASSGLAKLSKLDLLHYFTTFPYTQAVLRTELTIPSDTPPPPSSSAELEEYYWQYHPILSKIKNSPKQLVPESKSLALPSSEKVPSSGYVLHTFICALHCFLATKTFEEGAIMVVNMGNDADTVGAVYAGLAGCWYASSDGENGSDGLFWTERVRRWRDTILKRDVVEGIAEDLVRHSERMQMTLV